MRTLIFSDFDFTLWPHGDKAQIEKNLAAVKRFRAQGDLFGVATGRGLVSLRREWPEILSSVDFLITQDGAMTYEIAHGKPEPISTFRIPEREVAAVVKMASRRARRRYRDAVYFDGEKEMKKYRGGHLTKIRVWCTDAEDCRSLHRTLAAKGFNAMSYYNIARETNFDAGRLKWVHDDVTCAVEIRPRDVTKATAIRHLEPYLPTDVIVTTAGDDVNDVEMVSEHDGYGVNPKPELLKELLPGHGCATLAEVLEIVSP